MKKLSALILALILCCFLAYVPVMAGDTDPPDGGDDGGWIQPNPSPPVPPPPPDYIGPWPPEDETTSADDNTTDDGDDGGWIQPVP